MWWEIYRRWTLWDYVRRIRKFGWAGTRVDYDVSSWFTYSAGFWESASGPEVIMFGVPAIYANGFLAEAHRQLKGGELTPTDMAPWTLEDCPAMAWRAVHPSQIRREFFNVAIWYRERQGAGRAGLRAYQLFFTDTGGKFPWEDGFDEDYRPYQPRLYLPYAGPPDDD